MRVKQRQGVSYYDTFICLFFVLHLIWKQIAEIPKKNSDGYTNIIVSVNTSLFLFCMCMAPGVRFFYLF